MTSPVGGITPVRGSLRTFAACHFLSWGRTMRHDQLTGMTFGRLVAEKFCGKTTTWKKPVCVYKCRCECGGIAMVASTNLLYNRTRSCGCLNRALASERLQNDKIASKLRGSRMWHAMKLDETRVVTDLDVYQIQTQVGKTRRKHTECRTWRWTTKTQLDGSVIVTRVR